MITIPTYDFVKNSHCSYCGTKFIEQQSWPRQCFRCNNESYLNPIPIVVAMIPVWSPEPGDNKVGILIQRRLIEPKRGEWALPGGYLNIKETWQEGCAREVKEEVGLDTQPEYYDVFKIDLATNNNLIIFGLYRFAVEWEDIKFVPNEETDQIAITYEPMELAFPTHTSVILKYLDKS